MPEEAVGLSSDESVVEMWHPIKVFFRCRAFFQVFLALPNIYDSLQLDEIASSSCFLSFFSKIRLLCPSDCAKVFSTLFFEKTFRKNTDFLEEFIFRDSCLDSTYLLSFLFGTPLLYDRICS